MALVIEIQNATAAVFEPLVQHLVAADLKYPNLRGDALEILLAVDINPAVMIPFGWGVFRVAAARGDGVIARDGIVGGFPSPCYRP